MKVNNIIVYVSKFRFTEDMVSHTVANITVKYNIVDSLIIVVRGLLYCVEQ